MKSGKRDRVEGGLYKTGGRMLEAIGSAASGALLQSADAESPKRPRTGAWLAGLVVPPVLCKYLPEILIESRGRIRSLGGLHSTICNAAQVVGCSS
jgi:hypothetical protein